MTTMRYLAALAAGIRDAMADDPAVIFLGEDVRQNVRGTTPQLFEISGRPAYSTCLSPSRLSRASPLAPQ